MDGANSKKYTCSQLHSKAYDVPACDCYPGMSSLLGQAPYGHDVGRNVTSESESDSELTSPHHLPQAVPMPESISQQEVTRDTAGPELSDLVRYASHTTRSYCLRPADTSTGGISAAEPDSPKETASPPSRRLGCSRYPPVWQCSEEWLRVK